MDQSIARPAPASFVANSYHSLSGQANTQRRDYSPWIVDVCVIELNFVRNLIPEINRDKRTRQGANTR